MTLAMLDTNIVSHFIRDDVPGLRAKLVAIPMHQVVISSVTQAELMYGLLKRGRPKPLEEKIQAFLTRVQVLAWTGEVSNVYAVVRTDCEAMGVTLAPFDMMIAAHAVAAGAVLVTGDKAFSHVKSGLKIEDWTS